jgi:hypothetical protein
MFVVKYDHGGDLHGIFQITRPHNTESAMIRRGAIHLECRVFVARSTTSRYRSIVVIMTSEEMGTAVTFTRGCREALNIT